MSPLWAKFEYAWLAIYLLLLISWPIWGLIFWILAEKRKARAVAIPMLIGLVLLWPVISIIGAIILGINIFPVPQ